MGRLILVALLLIATSAAARDDGRYANSPLKLWLDRLASHNGLCCSFADGKSVEDVDWDTYCDQKNPDSCHYRVRLDGVWVEVPEAALVDEPNRAGVAVVWPYKNDAGQTLIRCFLPGTGT